MHCRNMDLGGRVMEQENKNVEPRMVTYAKQYAERNKGNFNLFIYGRTSGKFAGCKKKNKRIVRK